MQPLKEENKSMGATLNLDLIAPRHTQKKAHTSPDKSF